MLGPGGVTICNGIALAPTADVFRYELSVLAVEPDTNGAVSLIDTELNVDIAPSREYEVRHCLSAVLPLSFLR